MRKHTTAVASRCPPLSNSKKHFHRQNFRSKSDIASSAQSMQIPKGFCYAFHSPGKFCSRSQCSYNVSSANHKKDIQHSYAETGLTTKTQTALPTPINNEILAELLNGYSPDEDKFLKNGFSNGFSLQCDKPYENATAKNNQSVHEMPQTALDLINEEIELNRISGPHEEKPFPVFQISPLTFQPKIDPGKFRLIHNFFAPYDAQAINFNISEVNSTVRYANIQNAIEKIQQLGPNCFLAKCDI